MSPRPLLSLPVKKLNDYKSISREIILGNAFFISTTLTRCHQLAMMVMQFGDTVSLEEELNVPSKTFENLPAAKQETVRQALLTEFSAHNLADAQVARIVKDAGIARGAFYKYFTDLTDAYTYLYRKALFALHDYDIRAHRLQSAAAYVDQVAAFIKQVNASPYYELVKRHFAVNEALLQPVDSTLRPVTATEWAVMTLVHEAIKEGLRCPGNSDQILKRLKAALTALLAKEE